MEKHIMLATNPRQQNLNLKNGDWQTLRASARRKLPKFVFDYIDGGAGAELCMKRNRSVIDNIEIIPRVLTGIKNVELSCELFEISASMPVALAPMGLSELINPYGPLMLARACQYANIPFALSSATKLGSTFFNHITPPWYQLYIYDPDIMEEQISYVRNLGCQTLIITVDLPVSGRRMRDARNSFSPHISLKMIAQASMRPSWVLQRLLASGDPAQGRLDDRLLSRNLHALSWDDLARIRKIWPGNLVVKGVLDPDDALQCVAAGVDGLVISNHGGRQFDAAPSPFSVLEDIRVAVGHGVKLLIDGGINCGEDVVKALILGADGVLLGRLVLYALASGGERRVCEVISDIKSQIVTSMKLLGCQDVSALRLLRKRTGQGSPERLGSLALPVAGADTGTSPSP